MTSLNEQVFEVLYENLVAVDSSYAGKDMVLCPVCLREIPLAEVLAGGIEHIIPQVAAKEDSTIDKKQATLNQRCGITLLCRQSRACKSDGKMSEDGCNGMKGRLYDRLFKNLFDDSPHATEDLTHAHGVGILVMGYLAAFQFFGYEYILRPELGEIREQFDYPHERKTPYLDNAECNFGDNGSIPLLTATGQPFMWGGILNSDAPLQVMFRRCRAQLPGGQWSIKDGVRHLTNLIPARD